MTIARAFLTRAARRAYASPVAGKQPATGISSPFSRAAMSRTAFAMRLFCRLGASSMGGPGGGAARLAGARAGLLTPFGAAHPFSSGLAVQQPHERIASMTTPAQSAPALVFHDTTFHPIVRAGQPWLTAAEIGAALGYADDKSIHRIYKRHGGEFTERMTGVVKLTTPSGEQETRIFSLRGAHLLGMFARTVRAAEFRRWVLDILDRETSGTHGSVTLTADEAGNLASLFRLLTVFTPCLRDVEAALRIAQSPLAATVFDAWHEPSVYLFALRALKERCDTVRDDALLSIGQPVATGAGANPARPRTPVPFTGGTRGREWT